VTEVERTRIENYTGSVYILKADRALQCKRSSPRFTQAVALEAEHASLIAYFLADPSKFEC
jgi:hypothetical protein